MIARPETGEEQIFAPVGSVCEPIIMLLYIHDAKEPWMIGLERVAG